MKNIATFAALTFIGVGVLGCTSNTENAPNASAESSAIPTTYDYEAINRGTAEMTALGSELGMLATLAAEACLQENQATLDELSVQVADMLSRAEAVPDGGSPNMVIARTSAQSALLNATEGLRTCDPLTWQAVSTDMLETAAALDTVSKELKP